MKKTMTAPFATREATESNTGASAPRGIKSLAAAVVALCGVFLMFAGAANAATPPPVRDVTFFLQRLHNLESLPELENSHTAMSSTFDPSGGDSDGTWFRGMVNENTNVLLDVDGPGCVNRITDANFRKHNAETHIQIFIDNAAVPVIDVPTKDYFTPDVSPFPRPLIDFKTFPGVCLFPIP